jgi:hypothetical protein
MLANHITLQIAAAEASQGITHAFEGFLENSLQAGLLLPVLEDWSERFLRSLPLSRKPQSNAACAPRLRRLHYDAAFDVRQRMVVGVAACPLSG